MPLTSRRRRNRRLLRSSSSAGQLMQPAEKPDEKDDRKGNSNQPEQKAATHSVSSVGVCALRTFRVKLGSRKRTTRASAGVDMSYRIS
jgi:hypothetical protein